MGSILFPQDMYHTPHSRGFPKLLQEKGYEVRELPPTKVKRTALADLMPWTCDEKTNAQIHNLKDFGRATVQGRTYMEAYWRGGKYYATVEDYDRACTCPPYYAVEWSPHLGTNKIFSPELRGGHIAVETTRITLARCSHYVIYFNDTRYKKNWTESEVFASEVYLKTPLTTVSYLVNVLYETYQWVEWTVTAIESRFVSEVWRMINRSEPCQMSEEETWGIVYRRGVKGVLRVCDFYEYTFTTHTTHEEFNMIFPIGELILSPFKRNVEYREHNSTLTWIYRESNVMSKALLQVRFKHGPRREQTTKIWSLMDWDHVNSRFHKTFLAYPHWQLHSTILTVHGYIINNGQICNRDVYLDKMRTLSNYLIPRTLSARTNWIRFLYLKKPHDC